MGCIPVRPYMGTYVYPCTDGQEHPSELLKIHLDTWKSISGCISCYEAFQHFSNGFQKCVGRLRKKRGKTVEK